MKSENLRKRDASHFEMENKRLKEALKQISEENRALKCDNLIKAFDIGTVSAF